MAQTLLAHVPHPAQTHELQETQLGFELGVDHARHGLPPAPAQMHAGNALYQGWRSGHARFGERAPAPSRYTRQWLQLRLDAWQRALAFEPMTVTPNHLRQIDVARCPVTREPLAQGTGQPDDAAVTRLCDSAGYAAGNLAVLSTRAQRAMAGRDWQDAMSMSARADGANDGLADGLDAAQWQRLAVLMSFVTPLPHTRAARLPLCVQPPNRLRLLNPAQGLQAMITHSLGEPGWCRDMQALAVRLPDAGLRHDFNLFVSALLPRLIGVACDHDRGALRQAREDAWCDTLVNRRWQRFVWQLDARQTQALLVQGVGMGLAGVHAQLHENGAATDGWALHTPGHTGTSQQLALEHRASISRPAERPTRRASDRASPRLVATQAAARTQAKTATT